MPRADLACFHAALISAYRFLYLFVFSRQSLGWTCRGRGRKLFYSFEEYVLDSERRELRRGPTLIALQPQVFDLLEYLIRNRERVVSKDDLIAAIWN
jgi:DNA-binding response OmpR family regulator